MRRLGQVSGVAAFAVWVLLAASGCSDDTSATNETTTTTVDEEPPPPVATLDRAAYIQRLEQVCTDPGLGGSVAQPVGAGSSVQEIDAQISAVEDRLDLMREPEVPAGDKEAFDAVELAYDRALTTMSELSSAVEAGDTAVAQELATELDGRRDDVNDAVAAAEVGACSL